MAPNKPLEPSNAQDGSKTSPLDAATVQVDEFVYDTRSLAAIHPGGELFVKAFSGHDATEAFLSYHRKSFPHEKMTAHLVGKNTPLKSPNADADYLELCKLVEQEIPRHKTFATFAYYVKVTCLLTAALSLEYYIHKNGQYKWYLTGLLGWFFALFGLNIQHDANHGAVSRFSIINRVLGLTQNWIGGSAVDWIHQHVVQHHINPNDVDNDPDIVGNDFLRLNPLKPMMKVQHFQHLYIFVLLGFFGLNYIVESFQHVVRGFHKIHYSKLLAPNRIFEAITILSFAFRWIVLPLRHEFSVYTMLNVLPLVIVGGYYLSFFFVISHNFEGVHLFESQFSKTHDQSFLRKQVLTAANVGGAVLAQFNGGLNYQIEHHLFPRISHMHYPTIAPIVRAYCEKKGITYRHFPTIGENVASTVRHLYTLGHEESVSGFKNSQGLNALDSKKKK